MTGLEPGDEVFGSCEGGSYAEYARAKTAKLALKPANLTFEQAAALPVSGMTALQALSGKGRPKPGQRVLVIGASGGVGSCAVQLAAMYGAEVAGVCGPTGADFVRSQGAATSSTTPARRSPTVLTATTSSSTTRAFAPCPCSAAPSPRAAPSSSSAAREGAASPAV